MDNKRDKSSRSPGRSGINLTLVPVGRHLALDVADVVGKPGSEIALVHRDGSRDRGLAGDGARYRTSGLLAVLGPVLLLGRRLLELTLRRRLWLDLGVLSRNWNGLQIDVRRFNLWLRNF